MTQQNKERWLQIWPPPQVQNDPRYLLIEEQGCDICKEYFGWVTCRGGQYRHLMIVQTFDTRRWFIVNQREDTLEIIREFGSGAFIPNGVLLAFRHLEGLE